MLNPEDYLSKEQLMQIFLLGFTDMSKPSKSDTLVFFRYVKNNYVLRLAIRRKYEIGDPKKIHSIELRKNKTATKTHCSSDDIFRIYSLDKLGEVMGVFNV